MFRNQNLCNQLLEVYIMKLRKYAILIVALLVVVAIACFAVGCKNHEHSYTWEQTTPPTCTGEGVETGTCECGNVTTRPVDAIGHNWGEYVVTNNPTSDATGEITVTCSADATHTHKAALPVLSNAGYTVTPDGKDMYDIYSYKVVDEVTGEAGQVVSFEVCVHEHSYVWETVSEPTCTSAGLKKGICSNEYCGDVCEESIATIPHDWAEDVEILKEPTFDGTGLAQVQCSYDTTANHIHTYVLPSLSTYWKNHSEDGDVNDVVYNGWDGTVDAENDAVMHYTLSIYDQSLGNESNSNNYKVVVDVSASQHVHVYGEYEVVKNPGMETGLAVSSCCIFPDHEKQTVSLPKVLGAKNSYEFEEIDGKVYYTYTKKDVVVKGSYDAPTCISIKTGMYKGETYATVYSDGDTIKLQVGDVAQTISLYTPIIGKTFKDLNITVTDLSGNSIPFVTDPFLGIESSIGGVLIAVSTTDTAYYKSYYAGAYLLTIDAGNGLKSTFTVEPIYLAPSPSSLDNAQLLPQIWNALQGAWNFVNGTETIYAGVDLYIGAGSSNSLVDTSVTAIVENANGEDVTADVIVGSKSLGGKNGILFATSVEGVYTVYLTSTRMPSYTINFDVEVKGKPLPSELFNTDYVFATTNNTSKYTLIFTEINNDDANMTSTGVATLVMESIGTTKIPFTYTYGASGCEFVASNGSDRGFVLRMNNSYEIVLSYYDDFEEEEVELLLTKRASFINSLVGSYYFKNNTNIESTDMKVYVTVNQGGVYKLNITAGYFVCINVNSDTIPSYTECDYRVGKDGTGDGEPELKIVLSEGDTVIIYNFGGFTSTLEITYEGPVVDSTEGE